MSTLKPTGKPPLQPRASLRDCVPYLPRGQESAIDLRLDSNEAPVALANVAAKCLDTVQSIMIQRYPDAGPLEEVIGTFWGIEAVRVVVTSGADDALERALLATLDTDRTLVSVMPTFEMIPRYAKVAGAPIRKVIWGEIGFPIDEVLKSLDSDVGAVSVVTPNNPTGQIVPVDDLIRLATATRIFGAVLIVDLAYVEFSGSDPTRTLLTFDNVIIIRTFSKAWGMAGLRVGYAIAPEPISTWLRFAGSPYPVSGPSLQIARSMFAAGRGHIGPFLEEVQRERLILERLLRSLGFSVSPSGGNFVFARGTEAESLAARLEERGIAVRTFRQKELASCVRITCPGDSANFDRLCLAIVSIFPPAAILFDLDGVLADVSQSYDQAIIETCRHFGLSISDRDIWRIKREGDANNDWVITHRLLTQSAIETKFEEVMVEFERRYQGDGVTPGLRDAESLLIQIERLEALALRVPCGIVTGRPRADALRFLSRFGITELFDVIVCVEDALASKPSPQPLHLAAELLERAGRLTSSTLNIWMIGDTVDDVNAAIAAGMIPLGVCAPNSEKLDESTLERSGACVVRRSVVEFVDVLLSLTKEAPDATHK